MRRGRVFTPRAIGKAARISRRLRIPASIRSQALRLIVRFDTRRDRNRGYFFQADFGQIDPNPHASIQAKVSVVVPVYNGEKWIGRCIDSLLNVPRLHEIVVVDDGSTDQSLEIVKQFQELAPLRIVSQPNQGLPEALNTGFRLASGDYWTWVSHDNWLNPGAYEDLATHLDCHPSVGMVYGDYLVVGEDGTPYQKSGWRAADRPIPSSGEVRLPRNVSELGRGDNFIGPYFLYRSTLARKIGPYVNLPGIEDYEYWLRIRAHAAIVHVCNEKLTYNYTVHDDSMSAAYKELAIHEKRELVETAFQIHGATLVEPWIAEVGSRWSMIARPETPVVYPIATRRNSIIDNSLEDNRLPLEESSAALRLCLQVDTFGVGGVEEVLRQLSGTAVELGFEVSLAILEETSESLVGFENVRVKNGFSSKSEYAKWLKEFDPQIINTHFSYRWLEIASGQCPVIETLHNSYVWVDPIRRTEIARLGQHISCSFAVSHEVGRYAVRYLDRDRQRIVVTPNGVEEAKILPWLAQSKVSVRHQLEIRDERIGILQLGSLVRHKRADVSISAVHQLRMSGINAHLYLVGKNLDPNYAIELHDLCEQLELQEVVHFTGASSDPGKYLRALDVYFQPSLFEGWSLALGEAIAMGLPSVATDTGGARELSRHSHLKVLENQPLKNDWLSYENLNLALSEKGDLSANFASAARELLAFEHSCNTPEIISELSSRRRLQDYLNELSIQARVCRLRNQRQREHEFL